MHVARQRIISNRSLLQRARESDVPQYIQSKPFTPRTWMPYNFKIVKKVREPEEAEAPVAVTEEASSDVKEGEEVAAGEAVTGTEAAAPPEAVTQAIANKKRRWEDVRVQWLGDKCVADVAEALIGAAVMTGGIESALKISKDLGCYLPRVDRWSDFGRKVLAPPPEFTAELTLDDIKKVEEITGATITKPHIMAQALVSINRSSDSFRN